MKTSKLPALIPGLAWLVFATGACVAPVSAATFTWDGGGNGFDLGQAANWDADAIPQNNDVLQWNGTAAGPLSLGYVTAQSSMNSNPGISISVTADQTSSLLIDGGSSALRLNSGGISIASGAGAFTLGDGLGTSSFTVFNGAMAMTNHSANPATIGADAVFATTFAGNTTYNFNGSGNWEINANLRSSNNAGGNIVNALGTGTVVMNVANTYTGGTNIGANGGDARVRANANGALGSGVVFVAGNGGSNRLELTGGITLANALAVNGKGNSPGQPAAILNVAGANSLAGTITLNVGGSDNTIQSDAGLLTLSAATAITHGATGSRGVLFTGDGDITVSGAIAQGASTLAVTKQGGGTLTLSGNNTYTGATTVSAGTLLVTGALGETAVSVEAAATISGTGSLAGNLSLDAGAVLKVADLADPLSVSGTITLGSGFGIANLTGIDWDSLDLDTPYTLIATSQSFDETSIANFGAANAAPVGNGRFAFFETGSLAVVVIPEPATALLGGLGLLCLLRRRRN